MPERNETVRAAGGVVHRRGRDGTTEVLLVHRPKYDDWSFPKGKVMAGEEEPQAALREVAEETGLHVSLEHELPSARYQDAARRPKVVRYWAMSPLSGEFRPNREVDEVRWLPVDQTRALLTYEHDRAILDAFADVLDEGRGVTIYLLRHAEAGDREDWDGPDQLRPLTDTGWKQAEQLADVLGDPPAWPERRGRVERVFSSPYVRCVQTVEPLADRLGVKVEESDALAEGAEVDDAVALIRSLAGLRGPNAVEDTTAVLCTHGDVVPSLLERLQQLDALPLPGDYPFDKGSTWVLESDASGRFVRAEHLPPPA